jgi:hypothetical protein
VCSMRSPHCFPYLIERRQRELGSRSQTRMRWESIPIDLFFANTPFHDAMAARFRAVDYLGTSIDVLSPEDLIICKALYDRPKDWLDIESIIEVQSHLDGPYLRRWLLEFIDEGGSRLSRIAALLRARHSDTRSEDNE